MSVYKTVKDCARCLYKAEKVVGWSNVYQTVKPVRHQQFQRLNFMKLCSFKNHLNVTLSIPQAQ